MADDKVNDLSQSELQTLRELDFALERITDDFNADTNTDTSSKNSTSQPDLHTRLVLKDLRQPKITPLSVDFLSPSLLHRLKNGIGKSQPLAKALGLKSLDAEKAPYVIDATAGLGVDSIIIATYGCRVRSIERSAYVSALLLDGWRRLRVCDDPETLKLFRGALSRITFERNDGISVIKNLKEEERPDVIYLDPMYPEEGRSKSALPKKGMQLFRRLIGDDFDAEEILQEALKKAKDRVVVKRPLRAPNLISKPNHEFCGKTARFDMYLCR